MGKVNKNYFDRGMVHISQVIKKLKRELKRRK